MRFEESEGFGLDIKDWKSTGRALGFRLKKATEVFLEVTEEEEQFEKNPQAYFDNIWREHVEKDVRDVRYCIDENHLILSPTLATVFGIEKALILQQIHYFTCINRERNKPEIYLFRQRYWMYCTPAYWQKQFPFLSPATIKRKLKELEDSRVIMRRQSHKDDQYKTFYCLDYHEIVKMINGFYPTEKSFKLHSWKHIIQNAKYNEEYSVIQSK